MSGRESGRRDPDRRDPAAKPLPVHWNAMPIRTERDVPARREERG